MTGTWLLLLSFLGLFFLLVELLIIPGFGITGITGIGLLITSIVLSFLRLSTPKAILFSSAVVVVSSLAVIAFIKIFPHMGNRRGFVLKTAQDNKSAYRAAPLELEKLLGKVGETLTPLRPAGIAIFDGSRVDVVSEGGFLSKNTPVKVVKIEGRRVVVKVVK